MKRCFVALVLCAMASAANAAGQRRIQQEFGFSVTFPPNLHVCVNGSWRNPHGWGAPLAGTCQKPRTDRAIAVIGNYNAEEFTSPQEAALCAEREIEAGAKLGLSFEGHKSATCREDQPEGTVRITVVTRARKQAEPDDGDHQTASFFYSAGLTTTPEKLKDDLIVFRHVLRSVHLHPESATGPKPPFGF